jgi:hypothetical protein
MQKLAARFLVPIALLCTAASPCHAELQAGAAVIDITPEKLPVLVNGGMLSRYIDKINTRVNARAIVLKSGEIELAIVVADSCMMGRPVLDEAKAEAAKQTGIPSDRILISATHSHTAPSSFACLGTDADPAYVPLLRAKLVEAIIAARAKLQPARVGFAKQDAADFTALTPVDPTPGSRGRGSLWKHDGASQHARRSELG